MQHLALSLAAGEFQMQSDSTGKIVIATIIIMALWGGSKNKGGKGK